MKSANGIEIKVGQRAMVLRNDQDNPTHEEFGPPLVEDVVGVLGVIMHVTAIGDVSQVFLQHGTETDKSQVMGWWQCQHIVILQEAHS